MSTSNRRNTLSAFVTSDNQSPGDNGERSMINKGNSYFKYYYGMPGPSGNIFLLMSGVKLKPIDLQSPTKTRKVNSTQKNPSAALFRKSSTLHSNGYENTATKLRKVANLDSRTPDLNICTPAHMINHQNELYTGNFCTA